jgi:hypothetical protein
VIDHLFALRVVLVHVAIGGILRVDGVDSARTRKTNKGSMLIFALAVLLIVEIRVPLVSKLYGKLLSSISPLFLLF